MTQLGQTLRQFRWPSYENLIAVSGDEINNRSVTTPDLAEQMEINISAVIQVGRQLAIIGDEYNTTYSGKLEGSLFHLVKGMAATTFQTFWKHFTGVMESSEHFYNNGWRRKITGCAWIACVPLKCLCQKWVPATLFTVLMWWLITYGLRN